MCTALQFTYFGPKISMEYQLHYKQLLLQSHLSSPHHSISSTPTHQYDSKQLSLHILLIYQLKVGNNDKGLVPADI